MKYTKYRKHKTQHKTCNMNC